MNRANRFRQTPSFRALATSSPSSASSSSSHSALARDTDDDSSGADPIRRAVRQARKAVDWWNRLGGPMPLAPFWAEGPPLAERLLAIEAQVDRADSPSAWHAVDLDLAALVDTVTERADLERLLPCLERAGRHTCALHSLRAFFQRTPLLNPAPRPGIDDDAALRDQYRWRNRLLSRLAPLWTDLDPTDQQHLLACYVGGLAQEAGTSIIDTLAALGGRRDPVWNLPHARSLLEAAGLDETCVEAMDPSPWVALAGTLVNGVEGTGSTDRQPFALTDLPPELVQHIVNLCARHVHRLHPPSRCLRDIRAIARLSATNHPLHARTREALELAIACALRLNLPSSAGWRLSKLRDPGPVMHRLMQPPLALAHTDCVLWMLDCAVSLKKPRHVLRALKWMQTHLNGKEAPSSPAYPLLLAHVIRRSLITRRESANRMWQMDSALELMRDVHGLPHEDAVNVLIDIAAAMDGELAYDQQAIATFQDSRWVILGWNRVHSTLMVIDPGADEALIQVAALNRLEHRFRTKSLRRITAAHIDDALDCLEAHPFRFTGATATALAILERCSLTEDQAHRLAACVRNADARGAWRMFT